MRLPAGENKYIEFLYSLKGNSYTVGCEVNMIGFEQQLLFRRAAGQQVPAWAHDFDAQVILEGIETIETADAAADLGIDLGQGGNPGGDNHDMWIDPTNAARSIIANDDGVVISSTRTPRVW